MHCWRPAQWMDWVEAPKHFPKTTLARKKCHGKCLVVCCRTDPLQLSESQRNYYIWEVYSANQWDALKTERLAASTDPQDGPSFSPWQCPTAGRTANTSKVERVRLQYFVSTVCPPDLLPTDYHFFKHLDNFLQGKHFHNQQDAKNTVQEFIILGSTNFFFFFATGVNKLISHWQKCVDPNGSYFD